jgi:hypothetical protein
MMERLEYPLQVGNRIFLFQLCRKLGEQFGEIPIDHWWMEVTPLYGQRQNRNSADPNRRSVIECYGEYCRRAGDVREAQERVVLASLLPEMRSQGSRLIINDAFPGAAKGKIKSQDVNDLNALICQQKGRRVTIDEFHDGTLKLLKSRKLPGELKSKYVEMSESLFRESCRLLECGNGWEAMMANAGPIWSSWQKRYGRRSGHEDEKMVMNILSYEARAAFHHCYSVAWTLLSDSLIASHGITPPTKKFLNCWHRDLIDENRRTLDSDGCWSLFHGHVFALHPASARFGLTSAGKSLLGDFLIAEGNEESVAFERVLNGMLIAVGEYHSRMSDQSFNRKSRERSGQDIEIQSDRIAHRRYINDKRK